jgi:hypothetical protein
MRDFNHTIGVLVKAYLNDTLEHSECSSCAVGNIVRACAPDLYEIDGGAWYDVVAGLCGNSDVRLIRMQVQATGYKVSELRRIEMAFESAKELTHECTDTFNGLMAVVDVLAEIHGIDLTAREETKKLFTKEIAI